VPDLAKKIDDKKFMWDGAVYKSKEKAKEAMEVYQKDRFDVIMIKEEEQYFVYSRRKVSPAEAVVEGVTPKD
jgi:hypothetical protein